MAATAIWFGNFWLFVLANTLMGRYQAFAQYYRFAAADVASENFKSRAISWVIAGGVVAALAGPNIVRVTQGIGTVLFMATYFALSAASVAALLLVSRLSLPPLVIAESHGPARPLLGIALLGGHVAVALTGNAFLHFLSGLTLLGVGWNFLFNGGTTLLTEVYRPTERKKFKLPMIF